MPAGIKLGGRKKGTPNKKTAAQLDRAERIIQLIEKNYLDDDLENISSKDRMYLFSDLLEYVQPKLTRTDHGGQIEHKITVNIKRGNNPKS